MMNSKLLGNMLIGLCLASVLAIHASAESYSFGGAEGAEYYPATSYEAVYGTRYEYGGINSVDYDRPDLPYGVSGGVGIGVMEKVRIPGQTVSAGLIHVNVGSVGGTSADNAPSYPIIYTPALFTSVDGIRLGDGSIGTVRILSLGIDIKVWPGATDESMAKGLGHYASTSGWDGNVGLCGHNRGSPFAIGSIKDLKAGDVITYTTIYGVRTYEVSFVGVISNTDWSWLQPTSDNRITFTTCLANQPSSRVCVQGVEKDVAIG